MAEMLKSLPQVQPLDWYKRTGHWASYPQLSNP